MFPLVHASLVVVRRPRRTSLSLLAGLVCSGLPGAQTLPVETARKSLSESSFASSVGVDGELAVVGAPASRRAFVYGRDEGGPDQWGRLATLRGAASESNFGEKVAVDGDVVVVRSNRVSGAMADYSLAVFERDAGGPGAWGRVATLEGGAPAWGVGFALDGDTLLVTSQSERLVHVHRRGGGATPWSEVQSLRVEGAVSVVVDGDQAVVSAGIFLPGNGILSFLEREQGLWRAVQQLPGKAGSMALEGGLLCARGRLYERGPSGVWESRGRLAVPTTTQGTYDGIAVVGGRTIYVSDSQARGPAGETGVVYRFDRHDRASDWRLGARLYLSDPATVGSPFGSALAATREVLVVGDGTSLNTGGAGFATREAVFYDPRPELLASASTWSLSGSRPLTLWLDAGSGSAGATYVLLGSTSGTRPGLAVAGSSLRLAPDACLLETLRAPGHSAFGGTGILDGDGRASLTLAPSAVTIPFRAGLTLDQAFVVVRDGAVEHVSHPVSVALLP